MKGLLTKSNVILGIAGLVLLILGFVLMGLELYVGLLPLVLGGACLAFLWMTILDTRRATCSKCKKIMRGAEYEIEVLETEEDSRGREQAKVQVTAVCPFCGEFNYFSRKVTTDYVDGSGKRHQKNPIADTNRICKRIYREK